MFECLIVGDSIAVGIKQFAPYCELQGKGGINTWQFNKMYANKFTSDTVIISLGTNDHQYIKTEKELYSVRNRVKARHVFWILPAGNLKASNVHITIIQNTVIKIAKQYGDTILNIKELQKDGIHPSWNGYKNIVDQFTDKN